MLHTPAPWPSRVGFVALFPGLCTPIAPDNTLEPILEPFDGFGLVDAVAGSDLGSGSPPLCDSLAWSRPDAVLMISQVLLEGSINQFARIKDSHAAVKVHAVDTNGGIVFDPQIDVLTDAEPEVARLREVLLPQLVLLDFQPSLQDFLGFRPSNSDVDGNLLIASDTKRSDGVTCFAYKNRFFRIRSLSSQKERRKQCKQAYCRLVFGPKAARALWPRE